MSDQEIDPTRRTPGGHWLVFEGQIDPVEETSRCIIAGCHCGFEADPEDCGYGDSIVRHLIAVGLREAAAEVYSDERAAGPHAGPLSVATWLRARADQIENASLPNDTIIPERVTPQ